MSPIRWLHVVLYCCLHTNHLQTCKNILKISSYADNVTERDIQCLASEHPIYRAIFLRYSTKKKDCKAKICFSGREEDTEYELNGRRMQNPVKVHTIYELHMVLTNMHITQEQNHLWLGCIWGRSKKRLLTRILLQHYAKQTNCYSGLSWFRTSIEQGSQTKF